MQVADFLFKFLIILVSAKILAELFSRFRLPSVLGEVIAGILIGPGVLGIIQPDATFYLLAEVGILLLLFEVGMETDVGQLVKVGSLSSLVAVTGVIAPLILGYWLSRSLLGMSPVASLFIGGTLVATSIGITVRVFADLKKSQTKVAKIVLGAAVLDDVVGVVVLACVYDFAVKGEVSIMNTVRVLLLTALFLVAAPVLLRLLVPSIAKLSRNSRTKGMLPTIIVSLILLSAVMSHRIGAPEILGSFAAGIALTRKSFLPFSTPTTEQYAQDLGEKIESTMKPVIDLFVPLFFVMVGVFINLGSINFASSTFWQLAGLLTFVAVISKLVSGIWVPGPFSNKLSTGIAMVPRGEVGLIFAEVGRKNGAFDEVVYAIIVFVVAFTTLFAPLLLRVVMRREE